MIEFTYTSPVHFLMKISRILIIIAGKIVMKDTGHSASGLEDFVCWIISILESKNNRHSASEKSWQWKTLEGVFQTYDSNSWGEGIQSKITPRLLAIFNQFDRLDVTILNVVRLIGQSNPEAILNSFAIIICGVVTWALHPKTEIAILPAILGMA